ncbi:MAG: hypothetical protein KC443_11110, partial [Anaerolineales bacterium]|nr:hypothetical protein [Anaerolineales bacterium]
MKTEPANPPANGDEYITNIWSRSLTQPVAIAVMVSSIFVGVAGLINAISPGQPWLSLGSVFFLTALEAVYTTNWLHHPDRRTVARTGYRAAEFFFLLLILRVAAWFISKQPLPDLDTIRLFLRAPLLFFSDSFFLAMLILAFLNWLLAIRVGIIFTHLAVSPGEATFYAQPASVQMLHADNKPIYTGRGNLMREFIQVWLWGGVLLIISVGFSSIDLHTLEQQFNVLSLTHLGLPTELLMALVLYFLAGFWLTSQGRLEALNARWLINGIHKHDTIERHWQRNSLFVLLGIALIAAFVPIGSTLPISRFLNIALGVLSYATTMILYLFSFLLGALFSMLASRAPDSQPPPPTPTPLATPQPLNDFVANQQPPAAAADPAAMLVMSSIFWTIFIAAMAIAILFYWRERGYRVNGRFLHQLWNQFMHWVNDFWQNVSNQVGELRHTWQQQQKEDPQPAASKSSWRFVRLNALSPRDQIRYFYLSIVHRAQDSG